MITVKFEFNSVYGNYKDALFLAADHSFNDVEIENMKEERFNNWLTMMHTLLSEENVTQENNNG